jgi:sugar (pentulose or hexulose) kinase
MGKPVTRVQTFETSSLGAAIAGFLAIGRFANAEEAVKNMVHPSETFTPNAEIHNIYDYLYTHAYEKMYPKLKGIYKDIKDFNKREEKRRKK